MNQKYNTEELIHNELQEHMEAWFLEVKWFL